MKKAKDLDVRFQVLRRTFFPRWISGPRWRCRIADESNGAEGPSDCGGRCYSDSKLLLFDRMPTELVLTHEVCHAVTGAAHGKKWATRMVKAASDASKLGRADLAAEIHAEIKRYEKDAEKITAPGVCRRIEECVQDLPGASFAAVKSAVCREIGLSEAEFDRRYKLARRAYDRAHRELRVCHG